MRGGTAPIRVATKLTQLLVGLAQVEPVGVAKAWTCRFVPEAGAIQMRPFRVNTDHPKKPVS